MSPKNKESHSFCFICFGNICRSPALEAIFNALAKKRRVDDLFVVDSMALTTYYIGKQADPRMACAAEQRQIKIDHIAKLFKRSDFQRFDIVFAVTHDAADILKELAATEEEREKIMLATAYAKTFKGQDIPDPYYDGKEAFDLVVEMSFDACEGILDHFK